MRVAVVNCADTGPLESLAIMLKAASYETRPLSYDLAVHLRQLGMDNVRTINQTMAAEGVERPFAMKEATVADLPYCHLYVDVKAHRNGPKLWDRRPELNGRTLWYRINGGKPEIVYRGDRNMGDEIDPPCPVLTPNMWYKSQPTFSNHWGEDLVQQHKCNLCGSIVDGFDGMRDHRCPWGDRAYTMWPPFYRFDEYLLCHPRRPVNGQSICLVHNLVGWGFGAWADGCRSLGVRIYGYRSPDGLISHATLKERLATAQAMVHLKRSDAPGYALYEALSAACPVIISERLVVDNRMHDLFVDEETCLFFDRLDDPDLTHSYLRPDGVAEGVAKIGKQLDRLRDPELNSRIGLAGRGRLRELMWREDRDGPGFAAWMRMVFP